MAQQVSCGLEYSCTNDIQACLTEALLYRYTFIIVPIVHPRFKRHHIAGNSTIGSFTRSDMLLSPKDWSVTIAGKVSFHLDVDVPSLIVRQQHEDCLNEELAYCRGIGLSIIILNIHGTETVNLARLLLEHFHSSFSPSTVWARVPMSSKRIQRGDTEDVDNIKDDDEDFNETWLWWTLFHERMNWDKSVGLLLEVSADLPSPHIIKRWLGEPIKAIILRTSIFQTNRKGYPYLTPAHQDFVCKMIDRDAQVIISGAWHFNIQFYSSYIHSMYERSKQVANIDPMLSFAKGWEDFLQTPLQPLADNLDTYTYNVFEKDPFKYDQYQKAITSALVDLRKKEIEKYQCSRVGDLEKENISVKSETCHVKTISNQSENAVNELSVDKIVLNDECESNNYSKKEAVNVNGHDNSIKDLTLSEQCNKEFTVMVLGAGRGPLVRATLNAAEISKTKVKVLAIEKNPCAVVVLTAQAREIWSDYNVEVVPGDMRHLKLSPPADIIVSELLGSWGDNELSPECLDGAAYLLSPNGISIPNAYTSYATPICSPRLWAAAKAVTYRQLNHSEDKNLQTLWVVYMLNKFDIAETKPIFTFTHPSKGIRNDDGEEVKDHQGLPITDNRRTAVVSWTADQDSVLHGFAGYFDCSLYGDKMMSIVPSTHSPGMLSWFPVFIPIMTPIRVQKGEKIKATFWRCMSPRRVWYEWYVQVGNRMTCIHNANGKSSEMLL